MSRCIISLKWKTNDIWTSFSLTTCLVFTQEVLQFHKRFNLAGVYSIRCIPKTCMMMKFWSLLNSIWPFLQALNSKTPLILNWTRPSEAPVAWNGFANSRLSWPVEKRGLLIYFGSGTLFTLSEHLSGQDQLEGVLQSDFYQASGLCCRLRRGYDLVMDQGDEECWLAAGLLTASLLRDPA